MKQLFLLVSVLFIGQFIQAQSVGIGTATPHSSAQLDISSTTKGLLIPRMTGAQRAAIPAAPVGMMVIQTNTEVAPPSSPGLYLREQVGLSLVWRRIARTDEITSGTSTWTVSGIDQYSNVVGNVGIGTSANINEKLTVKGDALFVYPGSNSVTLSLMGNTNNQSRINFIKPDSSVIASIYAWDLVDRLYLQQGTNTNQLVLDDNGFVGIRNAIPSEALDVVGSIRSRDTITADDDIVAGDNIIAGDNITAGGTIVATSTIQGGAFFSTGNMLLGGTATVAGDLQTNSEMVINDPAATLHLKNGATDKGFVQVSGDNLRVGTYSTNTTGKFVIRTGGGDHFTVDSDGNTAVGIDPFNLDAKFAVFGRTRAIANGGDALETTGKLVVNENLEAIKIKGDNPAINFFEGATQRGYLWMVDNDMNLGTSISNGKMFLNSSQINMQTAQVTIGTSIATPGSYKLGVGGRIICEEVKVKLQSAGWPDYVFAKDYKLQSLEEVENFIKTNNHLPKIPSAQVIEKEGLEVGDMQRRMMEKIEELTLYIIEQNKRIIALENSLPGGKSKK